MDKKKPDWMSEAGHQSGERHARLEERRLRARAPIEAYADECAFWLAFIWIVGGVLGVIFIADAVRPAVDALIDGANETYTLGWFMAWLISRVAAFVVGMLAAFLAADVPLTFGLVWLKKARPELFLPRRG